MFQGIRVLKEVSYLLLGIVTLLVVLSRVFGANNTPPMLPMPDLMPPVEETTNKSYRWIGTNRSDRIALYSGDTQLGNWYVDENCYKKLVEHGDGSYHFEASPCPTSQPTFSVAPTTPVFTSTSYYQPQQTLQPVYYQPSFNAPVFRGNGGGRGFSFRGSVGGNCGPSG